MHTALGFWQAGRPEEAWRITEGSFLTTMFLGISPGNVGTMTLLDVYRRESQRDFGDGAGVLSRAIVEGLFGVKPDALAGELLLRPGFPAAWDHASIRHPDLAYSFRRTGAADTYVVEPAFARPQKLRLQLAKARAEVAAVQIDGRPAPWRVLPASGGPPRIEIDAPPAARTEIAVTWAGAPVPDEPPPGRARLAGEPDGRRARTPGRRGPVPGGPDAVFQRSRHPDLPQRVPEPALPFRLARPAQAGHRRLGRRCQRDGGDRRRRTAGRRRQGRRAPDPPQRGPVGHARRAGPQEHSLHVAMEQLPGRGGGPARRPRPPALPAHGRFDRAHAEPPRQRRGRRRLPGRQQRSPRPGESHDLVAHRPGLLHRRLPIPPARPAAAARGPVDRRRAGARPGGFQGQGPEAAAAEPRPCSVSAWIRTRSCAR